MKYNQSKKYQPQESFATDSKKHYSLEKNSKKANFLKSTKEIMGKVIFNLSIPLKGNLN